MRIRRVLIGLVVAIMVTTGVVTVADPALAAVPSTCIYHGFSNGRHVNANNFDNGGGADVDAYVCWYPGGNGYYDTGVYFTVTDTLANGAGATIRMEWQGTDTATHYDVPPSSERAWSEWSVVSGIWHMQPIRLLYVRACLTNTDSPAHNCGAKA